MFHAIGTIGDGLKKETRRRSGYHLIQLQVAQGMGRILACDVLGSVVQGVSIRIQSAFDRIRWVEAMLRFPKVR